MEWASLLNEKSTKAVRTHHTRTILDRIAVF